MTKKESHEVRKREFMKLANPFQVGIIPPINRNDFQITKFTISVDF